MGKKLALVAAVIVAVVVAVSLWIALGSRPELDDRGTSRGAPDRTASDIADAASATAADGKTERGLSAEATRDPSPAGVAAAAPAGDASDIRVRGRVIDERHAGVADAVVTLSIAGRAAQTTRSDALGEFRFSAATVAHDAWARVGIFALAPDRHVGARATFLSLDEEMRRRDEPTELTIDTIVVRAGGSVRVQVRDDGGAVAGAQVAIEVGEERALGPRVATDGEGVVELPPAPAGKLLLLASAPGRGRARATVECVAGATQSIELRLRPMRRVDVVVTHAKSGEPIEGAAVVVCETMPMIAREESAFPTRSSLQASIGLAVAPTDRAGRTVLDALEHDVDYSASVTKPGWVAAYEGELGSFLPIGRELRELHLILGSPRDDALHWKLDPATPLADGAELQLRHAMMEGHAVPTRAQVEGERLVVRGTWSGSQFSAWAFAPDGRIARLRSQDAEEYRGGVPLRFLPARALTVTVRDPQGHPLPRLLVAAQATTEGTWDPLTSWLTQRTGADGVARFRDLIAESRQVAVSVDERARPTLPAGLADLRERDVELAVELPAPYEVLVEFRIDGERRLPTEFSFGWATSDLPTRRVEDAARGDVHLWYVPFPGVRNAVAVFVPGRLPVTLAVPPPADAAPVRLPLEIGGGAVVIVRMVKQPEVVARPRLERWDEKRNSFGTAPGTPDGIRDPNQPDGSCRFEPLPPGRYRAVETLTGVASDEVAIGDAGGTFELTLDLSAAIAVSGRIELPGEESAAGVQIFALDADAEPDWRPGAPRPRTAKEFTVNAGLFWAMLDTTHRWRLGAVHPWLTFDDSEGPTLLTRSRSDLVARFVEGPVVTFVSSASSADFPMAGVMVRLLEPGHLDHIQGMATAWARRDGTLAFTPPPVGTFDVLLIPWQRAPLLLPGVTFDGASRDLGTIAFPRGSELTIRLRSRSGGATPEVIAMAQRIVAPIWAVTNEYDQGEDARTRPRLRGLSAGRYRVTLRAIARRTKSAAPIAETEVEVDGEHDREIEILVD